MTNQTVLSPSGQQQLSKNVYFIDDKDEIVRPVFQQDQENKGFSYRLYPDGGNTKDGDEEVQDERELARHLLAGCSVRCRLPDGASSNRSIKSRDVRKFVVEVGN